MPWLACISKGVFPIGKAKYYIWHFRFLSKNRQKCNCLENAPKIMWYQSSHASVRHRHEKQYVWHYPVFWFQDHIYFLFHVVWKLRQTHFSCCVYTELAELAVLEVFYSLIQKHFEDKQKCLIEFIAFLHRTLRILCMNSYTIYIKLYYMYSSFSFVSLCLYVFQCSFRAII